MVLQDVLETIGGASIDSVVRRQLFEPLGMTQTWYSEVPRDVTRAFGHVALLHVVTPFALVFIPLLAIGLGLASLTQRVRRRRWRLTTLAALVPVLLSLAIATWFFASRAAVAKAAIPFAGIGFSCIVLVALLAAALYRWMPLRNRMLRAALSIAVVAVVTVAAARQPIPLSDLVPPRGNVASSLRTSARDLGRFLEELTAPKLLSQRSAAAYADAQVVVGENVSWGLGIGVQRDANGLALFHWGSNPSVRSFLLCYPQAGSGIVVLANGDLSRAGIVRIVQTAVGGGGGGGGGTQWQSY